jgi:thiamine-monophosphate kinase
MPAVAKSEDSLIAWIAARHRAGRPDVPIGIGDDMAMIRTARRGAKAGGPILITADMLMDGVDFDTKRHSLEWIGRKALAAGLSDCAAMAARPRYVVVSVALPSSWSIKQVRGLYRGLENLARAYGCAIVGGDTNSWRHPLAIDVTVLAEPWPGVEPVRRDGMRTGDAVCVTGQLGGSLYAGGRGSASRRPRSLVKKSLPHHLTFTPRVWEAHWLAARLGRRLHAMMDLSDGLSTDATRMAAASGCGIEFDAAALEVVVSGAARMASAQDGRRPLDHLLNDGEDFELLFSMDQAGLDSLKRVNRAPSGRTARPPDQWTRIGAAVRGAGVWLRTSTGRRLRIESGGWQHVIGR